MRQLARRESELNELQDALDEAAAGWGQLVVVSGPVGIGKTALLHAFGDEAAKGGARVLRACVLDKARTSHSVLEHLPGDVASPFADDGSRPVDRFASELLDFSASAPIVLLIDDLDDVDVESPGCLGGLLARIWSARILVVASEATGAAEGTGIRWTNVVHPAPCRFLPLGPLTPAAVSEMLAESSGFLPTTRIAERCLEITGGSPALLRALVRDMNAGPYTAGTEPLVGGHFSRVVVSCLHRCAPDVAHIARAVAVLGDDASPPIVAMLARRNQDAVNRAVAVLTDMGLLSNGRFRHAGARAAVLNDMTDEERSTLHGRAARLLYDEGASATVVAGHLAATHQIEGAWSVSALAESAQHALEGGDVTLATSCLRLAREACSGKAECARLTAALMRVQWWVNPAAARRHLSGLLEELWAGYLEPRDALTVFGGLFWTGQVAEAERALELLSAGGTPPQDHAWLSAWFSAWYPRHAPALSTASQQGTVSSSLMGHLWQRRTTEGALAGMDDFLSGSTADDVALREVVTAFTALVHSDPADDVVARCYALEPQVDGDAPVAAQALYQACRALVALRTGDTEEALAHAEAALGLMPAESWGVALAVPLACAVTATTVMGRYEEGANHLARALPEAAFDTPFGLLYLQARGQFYLATGRPRNGLSDLEECEQRLATWRVALPGLATWRSQAAQALVELGEVRKARRMVDLQLSTLSREQVRLRGTTLRIRAATEPPDRRTPLLSKAIGLLQQSGDRLELARAFADLARTHTVLGEQALARTAAQRCAVLAEQCAAQPLLERMIRAFPELRAEEAISPNNPDAPILSTSERKVAVLASQGHTNRQIAKKLHVTVSTVEQHLTRVYRKLQIRRRSELTLRLALGEMGHAGPRGLLPSTAPLWCGRTARDPDRCLELG
ncbi:AAA family ATPase [Streptomyces sp. NL15-2K]|uniref:AAA family ATPase n=1 Tax=Streptomyces sp. NL15-2K TaxID=376149 RepID=UPI000F568AB7|nr:MULTISPECIES: LuxR family transcriptional regulator [Actinomycetes]WKX06032.1 AAA family ATPase [Kutzneria buriramensis]GCB53296.1 regulatory protein [Streptomyces sp. NL15-2K]